jgi:hypothetical protein
MGIGDYSEKSYLLAHNGENDYSLITLWVVSW